MTELVARWLALADVGLQLGTERERPEQPRFQHIVRVAPGQERALALAWLTGRNSLALGNTYVDGLWDVVPPPFADDGKTDDGKTDDDKAHEPAGSEVGARERSVLIEDARDGALTGVLLQLLLNRERVQRALWASQSRWRWLWSLAWLWLHGLGSWLLRRVRNDQSVARSREVARVHYDISPELYKAMLDSHMQYSCAFFRHAPTAAPPPGPAIFPEGKGEGLEAAQARKLAMIARKLHLEPGMTVLDIGCGFGGLARYLAQMHQVRVLGVTISREQLGVARTTFAHPQVTVLERDYRLLKVADLPDGRPVDRIVSVGMFEHVGHANHGAFFGTCKRLLHPERGLVLLHTVGTAVEDGPKTGRDPWILRWIFPGGELPTLARLAASANVSGFSIEDVHNWGLSYADCLASWSRNFNRAVVARALPDRYLEPRFIRLWKMYLCGCRAAFLARRTHLYQLLLSPISAAPHTRQADWARPFAP